MKTRISLVAVLVFAVGIFGAVGPLLATPDDSQRLRGLGGRIFEVTVVELPDGEPFANCYFFEEDGTWIDPPFPGGPGTWVQHTNGASTTYTAVAEGEWVPGVYLVLEQNGAVTPAQGSGVLQLEATSIVDVLVGGEVVAEVEFYSVGFQNNDCSVPEA